MLADVEIFVIRVPLEYRFGRNHRLAIFLIRGSHNGKRRRPAVGEILPQAQLDLGLPRRVNAVVERPVEPVCVILRISFPAPVLVGDELERAREKFNFTYLPEDTEALLKETFSCFTSACYNAFASMCRYNGMLIVHGRE